MPSVPPAKDLDLREWAAQFDQRVGLDPPAYGIDAASAARLHAAVLAFTAALTLANAPITRTPPNIAAKQEARVALLKVLRPILRIVNAQDRLDDEQRINLGLPPRPVKSRAPAPATRPFLCVDHRGRVRLRDESAPHRRAKPDGLFGAALFMVLAEPTDPAPADIRAAQFAGIATRASHQIPLPPDSAGKKLWVLARWINQKGQTGPTSAAAGSIVAA